MWALSTENKQIFGIRQLTRLLLSLRSLLKFNKKYSRKPGAVLRSGRAFAPLLTRYYYGYEPTVSCVGFGSLGFILHPLVLLMTDLGLL